MSSGFDDRGGTPPVDLLVVGTGAAGLAAAVTAAHAGLDVVVVEKSDIVGGTTAKSGGVYWVPGNHLQRAHGIDDGAERALPYMARVSAPEHYDPDSPSLGLDAWSYELVRAYPERSAEAVEFLDRIGALRSTIELALSFPDYHMSLPEQGGIYGRALCPATPVGTPGKGDELTRQLEWAARRLGARFELSCQLVDLVVEDSAVAGAVVEDAAGGRRRSIRARLGVVLAVGGFTHDPARRAAHLPAKVWGGCASWGNAGDVLGILESLGVPLHNMDTAWWDQVAVEHTIDATSETRAGMWVAPGDSSLIVDRHGRRVVNEKAVYNERAKIHLGGPSSPELLFLIFDQRTVDLFSSELFAYPLPMEDEKSDHIVTADSWNELAEALGRRLEDLAPHVGGLTLAASFEAELRATVERFNGFARAGVDDDFGRGQEEIEAYFTGAPRPGAGPNPTMAPLADAGPYHAVIVGLGTLDTKGGPKTDVHGRVLGTDGAPVDGLYAAGNCAASPTGHGYWAAGATIGPAIAFGHAAAKHAAARKTSPAPAQT